MRKGHDICCYDYVNRPYERVSDALRQNALGVFQSTTKTAASGAQSVASELQVNIGSMGVKTDIKISVKNVQKNSDAISNPSMRLVLEWEAATMPRLFPLMRGELAIYPLRPSETQLDFSGTYKPPFRTFGKTVNAFIGHRIAEASVHRFISDVAAYLRQHSFSRPVCLNHRTPTHTCPQESQKPKANLTIALPA